MSSGDAQVPSGAILTAIKMVEGLASGEEEPSEAFADEVVTLVKIWGVPVVVQAFGFLIGVAMSAFLPEGGEPDRLHLVLPAVLTRLRQMVPQPLLATMAGVLTAAAVEEEPYQWRQDLGPIRGGEALAWCYTAWLVADFIDSIILGKSGEFTRRVITIVLDAESRGEI